MDHVPIKSSNIQSVAYDPETQTLECAFGNGTYEYQGVPKEIYQGLLMASSAGSFFAKQIKPYYQGTRV